MLVAAGVAQPDLPLSPAKTSFSGQKTAKGDRHEGVGFQLADNLIELKEAELMIDWCADVLDGGSLGAVESSMTKIP
jgi:hypothetical protein